MARVWTTLFGNINNPVPTMGIKSVVRLRSVMRRSISMRNGTSVDGIMSAVGFDRMGYVRKERISSDFVG